jgi:alpha-beta hydrolase superfamily lysophospholipase
VALLDSAYASQPPLFLVAHSMGGVLARGVANGPQAGAYEQTLSLGTARLTHPRAGALGAVLTLAAPLVASPWLAQARTQSPWLLSSSSDSL